LESHRCQLPVGRRKSEENAPGKSGQFQRCLQQQMAAATRLA
jgi:hypothetical protein